MKTLRLLLLVHYTYPGHKLQHSTLAQKGYPGLGAFPPQALLPKRLRTNRSQLKGVLLLGGVGTR